jgi:hypothetical protein
VNEAAVEKSWRYPVKKAKTRIGTCRLCGVTGPLCLSHLIPKRVFEVILSSDPGQKAPIMMTNKLTVKKHAQIKDYLLCERCEDLFNKNGERYVFEMMNTKDGFKLLDRLNVAPPMSFNVADHVAFSGEDIGLDMDKLAYFGLSVFWRAGAHTWPSKLTVDPTYSIDLGPWLDPIAKFLLGGAWPSGLSLMVTAAEDRFSKGFSFYPGRTVGLIGEMVSYGFLTCGIHFSVFLANPVPFPYALFCCTSAPRRLIFMRNIREQTMHAAGRLRTLGRVAENMQR